VIVQDLRHAFRALSHSPRFTLLAASVLALGLGLNATIFTVVNAVLFKGLPGVTGSERIVYIGTQQDGRGCEG
jgi:hypothetical protein